MSAYLDTELSLAQAAYDAARRELSAAEARAVAASAALEAVRLRIEEAAMRDPQPGDRWSEMLSFWVYVVERDGDTVTIQSAGAPCTFPQDATEETMWLSDWLRWNNGHRLTDRGNDVADWKGKAGKTR